MTRTRPLGQPTVPPSRDADDLFHELMVDDLVDYTMHDAKTPFNSARIAWARAAFSELPINDLIAKLAATETLRAAEIGRHFLNHPSLDGTMATLAGMDLIAQLAAKPLLRYYHSRAFTVITKNDAGNSPVTEADMDAETIIKAGLKELSPGVTFVGEESVARILRNPERFNPKAPYYLVDAMDGTKSFRDGYPDFTVNIAYIENGKPAIGVVHAPVSGRTYAGVPAFKQAFSRSKTGRAYLLKPRERNFGLRMAVMSYNDVKHRQPQLDALLGSQGINMRDSFKRASSLRGCAVANGSACLYPQLFSCSAWDIAAVHAVLEAAGGHTTDMQGAPLNFGDIQNNFALPPLIMAASPNTINWPALKRPLG